jgi:large subunit ribosomal protein L25
MKVVSLSGSLRESVGKKDAKKVRKEGLVPCVIYGGENQIHFTVKSIEFDKLLFTPDVTLVDIDIDGQVYRAVIQDLQYHPVTDKTLHVDFLQVFEEKPVKIAVPVKIVGTSPGVIKGGKLNKKMRKVLVMALEKFLPDFIEVDISSLDIGMSVRVEDLNVEGLTFMDPARSVVVAVKTARVLAAENEEDEDEEGEEGAEGGDAAESAE